MDVPDLKNEIKYRYFSVKGITSLVCLQCHSWFRKYVYTIPCGWSLFSGHKQNDSPPKFPFAPACSCSMIRDFTRFGKYISNSHRDNRKTTCDLSHTKVMSPPEQSKWQGHFPSSFTNFKQETKLDFQIQEMRSFVRKFVLKKVMVEENCGWTRVFICCLRKAFCSGRDVHTVSLGKTDLTRANHWSRAWQQAGRRFLFLTSSQYVGCGSA